MNFRSLLALAALLPALAGAEVNPKNGNYVVTFQEMTLKAPDAEIALRRTFNSRASRDLGWFGWGWSSPYETRVHAMPDGSVVVRENGTGLMHFYDPAEGGKQHEAGLDALVTAARSKDKLNAKQATALRKRLHDSEELRVRTAMRLGVSGKATPGTRWTSRLCGEIERFEGGWKREACVDEAGADLFSDAGVLLRSVTAKQDLEFDWDGPRLKSVVDSSGLAFHFAWTPEGQVASVKASTGEEVRYTYSPIGELVRLESRATGGPMDFTYDRQHRLTSYALIDTTKEVVSYNADGMVSSVVSRTGAKTTFTYGGEGNAYWTEVRRFAYGGELQAERRIAYDVAPSPTGEHALKKVVVNEDDFEITTNSDGTVEIGGPAMERLRRALEEAKERADRAQEAREKARLEATRRREAEIRRFSSCVVDASALDHEEKQLKWNAERGNLTRTAAKRQFDAISRRNEAFNRQCAGSFALSTETLRNLCSHPAHQSEWCDNF